MIWLIIKTNEMPKKYFSNLEDALKWKKGSNPYGKFQTQDFGQKLSVCGIHTKPMSSVFLENKTRHELWDVHKPMLQTSKYLRA
jgi:hypothetical protein